MNSNILFSLRNKQSRLFLNKESALKPDSERALFLFRVSGIPFLVSEKGDIIFARPYGGIQGVRWFLWCVGEGLCPSRGRPQGSPLRKRYKRCGEESPSHGFAVPAPFRQGGLGTGERIATASVRTGFAMTGVLHGVRWMPGRADRGRPPLRKCRNACVGRRALTPP